MGCARGLCSVNGAKYPPDDLGKFRKVASHSAPEPALYIANLPAGKGMIYKKDRVEKGDKDLCENEIISNDTNEQGRVRSAPK